MKQVATGAEMGRLVVGKLQEWKWCHGEISVARRWLVKSIREIHASWSRAMLQQGRPVAAVLWRTVMTSALQCYHENGAWSADVSTLQPGWNAVFRWTCSVLTHAGGPCRHRVVFNEDGVMQKAEILKMMMENRDLELKNKLTSDGMT